MDLSKCNKGCNKLFPAESSIGHYLKNSKTAHRTSKKRKKASAQEGCFDANGLSLSCLRFSLDCYRMAA